jgi:hypothetical protein
MPDNKYLSYLQESKEEDDIKKAIRQTKSEYKRKRNSIKKKINDARVKYSQYTGTVGHTVAKEIIGTFETELVNLQDVFTKKLASLYSRLKVIRSKRSVKTLAIASIILASYELYDVYIKKYKEQCSKKKGFDKILCYRRARLKALEQRIIYLKKSMNAECAKTKDLTKCKIRISNEIEKLTKKVEKYRELI